MAMSLERFICCLIPCKKWRTAFRESHSFKYDDVLCAVKNRSYIDYSRVSRNEKNKVLRNLFLAHSLTDMLSDDFLLNERAGYYKKHMESKLAFSQYIKGKRIAVVGNSPCEKGKGRGREIDDHDLVVRMNNFQTSGFEQDYGTKCNIWLRSGAPFERVPLRPMSDFEYTIINQDVINQPFEEDVIQLIKFLDNYGHRYFILDNYIEELARKINGSIVRQASSGIMMLYYLYRERGGMDGISPYGFSFTDQLENGADIHYFRELADKMPDPRHVPHNWHNEKEFYGQLIKGEA